MIIQPLFNAPIHYATSLGNLNTDNTCLNDATVTGVYSFEGGETKPIDSGTTTTGQWALLVLENGNIILQIAERLGLTDKRIIYTRSYTNNTWSEWIENKSASEITCDDALSATSANPIQNKAVTQELNKKLNVSGGTMSGELKAQANTNYTSYQVRNMAFSTSASLPTGNGSVIGVYT